MEALASGIRERGYFRVDRGKLVLVDSFGGWIYGKTCMNGISKIKLKMKETIQIMNKEISFKIKQHFE